MNLILKFHKDQIKQIKQIKQKFMLNRLSATLLLSLSAAFPVVAQAAEIDVHLPRPGLYRIDMDATSTVPIATTSFVGFRQRTDGNGDVVAHQFVNGERSADQFFKGDKPSTLCIGPRTTGKTADLAAIEAISKFPACPDQSTTYTKDGFIHTANCPSNKMTLTIKKIAADTWEYITETTMFNTAAGPDVSGMRFILEHTVKNAATAKERAEATKRLAELPELQRKMSEGQIEMIAKLKEEARTAKTPEEAAMYSAGLAQMTGKTPTMVSTSKERLTRISAICDSSVMTK